ncbi:S8 family peptidase [Aliiglaciecola litoralis]
MKKFTINALAAATMALTLPSDALAEAVIGKQLAELLPTMTSAETVMAVVTYNQLDPVSTDQLEHLSGLGISQAVQFSSVPIIGVVANVDQIQAIAQRDDVRSVWLNRQLEYFNSDARQITGVDALQGEDFVARNGMEYTGKGVTIMVNDSGIDATHLDLFFGDKVIDNVQGITHANALRITGVTEGMVIKNQPNTDTNSGHGTHVAGTIAGLGTMSDGKYVGAAPDAKLVGYGSGAVIAILDTIGAYDYAISNVYSYESPLRVMSNSWGTSGKFDPTGPVALASYKAHKVGILSVFAAGNSGSGEDTNNPYAQIPWGMAIGAGEKNGTLANFSSRGYKWESGDFSMPDGSEWTYNNEITVVAPGVNIISTRATTNAGANGKANDIGAMDEAHIPFYTMISGTSMATPHVSGIVALMLEANPSLDNSTIKKLIQETATNMPGYERYEVGAGYINARAAVAAAKNYDMDHKTTVNNLQEKSFNANAVIEISDKTYEDTIWATPVGSTEPVLPDEFKFEVHPEAVWVKASAMTFANTAKLVLIDPLGNEYFGNMTLPVLTTQMRVAAPAMEGIWTVRVDGITTLSGVAIDPAGATNGPMSPDYYDVTITFEDLIGFEGVDDIEGHPYEKAIQYAVGERLVDGFNDRGFRPDAKLKRKDLAKYLVMGGAVRQYRDLDNESQPQLTSVPKAYKAFAESVSVSGGALKDDTRNQMPIMLNQGGDFDPKGRVTKLDLAYSLVQVLGMEDAALAFDVNSDITVDYKGQSIVLADQNSIPEHLKGYVQVALELSLLNVNYGLEQGPYDLMPTLTATFNPDYRVSRGEYAITAGRLSAQYFQ